METFIRKSLGLKAHTVVKVELREADAGLVVQVERLGHRRLRCGACGREARQVAPTRRPERRWHDLAMRTHQVWLVYAPYRVWCRQCGLRVEQIPWADQWQRVTHALARAVAELARELDAPRRRPRDRGTRATVVPGSAGRPGWTRVSV